MSGTGPGVDQTRHREETMRRSLVALAAAAGLSSALAAGAGTEENAEDFMALHKIEIAFHEAGTT